jgi:hypothetical protein
LAIVDVLNPRRPRLHQSVTLDGALNDAEDVIVASTNASLFAYVADGRDGLKVLQLTAPDTVPGFYGFSPDPEPELIARFDTRGPALALPRPLERDRAVDETGHQIAVFGRLGSGPLSIEDMRRLYMNEDGSLWFVRDDPDGGPADSSVAAADGESESDSDRNSEAPAAHTAGERDHDSGQPQGVGGG